jgi:CRP-like cAMP-binding protein
MEMIAPLLRFFQRMMPLDGEEEQLLRETFRNRLYRKRQYVLQEGDVCNSLSFVVRGCLRMYKIDDAGNVHILQFAVEEGWINDLGSFHGLRPSQLNIDALEDTVVLQISREELVRLYTDAPKFNRLFRVLTENSFVQLQERLLQSIGSAAEDRYHRFLELYPELSGRLSQVQIAAYLGVSPEFLSRLRGKMSKAKKP